MPARAPSEATITPGALVVDGKGGVIFADSCSVRRLAGDRITTLAGSADDCSGSADGGDGGPATQAYLDRPEGIARAADGALYIAEANACRIRRVAGGVITTVAGNGECGFSGDGGPATEAMLSNPTAVLATGAGALVIADAGNCRVRRVRGGSITTIAGTGECGHGGDGGPATSATINTVGSMAESPDGAIYLAQWGNCRIRMILAGSITTVAGTGTCAYGGDGGPATTAEITTAHDLSVGADGAVYVADAGNCRIRRFHEGGNITTVVGNGNCEWSYVPPASEEGEGGEEGARQSTSTTVAEGTGTGGKGQERTDPKSPTPEAGAAHGSEGGASPEGPEGANEGGDAASSANTGDGRTQAGPPGGPGAGSGRSEVDAGDAGRLAAVILVIAVLSYAAFTIWRRRQAPDRTTH